MGLFDIFNPSAYDDTTITNQTDTSTVNLRDMEDINAGEGELARESRGIQMDQLQALKNLLTRGGTQQVAGDIDAARGASLTLADMLRQAQGGPSAANIGQAQSFASQIFAPQEQALQQQFQRAETDTSRLAARLGRPVDDPILRAKLAEAQGAQMGQLQAQKGAFAAQNAQGFMQQGLGLQEQIANIRGGLATQALQNRQALMGMGQSLLNQERNFRLQTAGRTTSTSQSQTQKGGIGDVIGGVGSIAGIGLDLYTGGAFSMAKAGASAAGGGMAGRGEMTTMPDDIGMINLNRFRNMA